tara:strand:- start:4212 stop:7430 length:3219 start_codon:yes stop_codon:yes gene_type:complete
MAGMRTGGPNFPNTPQDGDQFRWMWWSWEYSTDESKWNVIERLDSPAQETPGLIYYTPGPGIGEEEPELDYEWWWIPHVTDPETGVITTHGKMHVRDRSNVDFSEDVLATEGGEWQEIQLQTDSDPTLRGIRGKTIWADYGPPETNLIIDGNRPNYPPGTTGPPGAGDVPNNWPYSGDVDDLIGDMYIDLATLKLYGPKYLTGANNDQPTWGDGISLYGDPNMIWRGEWDCHYEYDYIAAPHDVVSHRQADKNIVETWICVDTVTPSCETPVLVQNVSASFADAAGDIGHPPACRTGDFVYFRHDKTSTDSYHYWIQFVNHTFVEDGNPGTYAGPPSLPSATPNDESVTYDHTNVKHHLVQCKVGGPHHSRFRFRTPGTTTWNYENGANDWFTTGYTGGSEAGGGDDNQNFDLNAYQPSCWSTSGDDDVGDWADQDNDGNGETPRQLIPEVVSNAIIWVGRTLYNNYTLGENSWAMNWWFEFAWGGTSFGNWSITDHGTGSGPAHPKFYLSVKGMFYHRGNCNGQYSYSPPQGQPCASPQSSIWGVVRSVACPGSGSLYTYDLTKNQTDVLSNTEPYEGSPYWERMLGAGGHGDISVGGGFGYFTAKQSGVEFRFGGFHSQDWEDLGQIPYPEVYWRDYKTFDQIPMLQEDPDGNYLSMGQSCKTDASGPEDIAINYPSMDPTDPNYSPYYKEWGFTGASDGARWIRTVGRNYDKTPKAPSSGNAIDWTDHNDTYIVLEDGESIGGDTEEYPLPNHWLCLKPGNTYKITIGAWVKPQYYPIIADSSVSNLAPITWRKTQLGQTSTSPLDDFQNGWYELMLFTFPSAFSGSGNNYVTQAAYGAVNPEAVEQDFRFDTTDPVPGEKNWWVPFNTHIHGIGSPKDIQMYDDCLIDPRFCLSYSHCTFDASDFVEHDSQLPAQITVNQNEDILDRYRGSEKPSWDGGNNDWHTGDPNTYNIRNNGKYIENTFLYTPTEEFLATGVPGSSWIGLYYDASWWANGVYSARNIFNQTWSGEHTTDIGRGTMAFYPDEADGWYESNPDKVVSDYSNDEPPTSSLHRKGGFLRIELVNDVS